jgi:hypothetical protein
MKKISFFFLLMGIAFSVFAQSPEPEPEQEAKPEPKQEYERRFSFQINPLMYLGDLFLLIVTKGDVYGFLTGFEFQWALTKYWNISIEPRFGINKSAGNAWGFGYGSAFNLDDFEREKIIHVTINPGVLYRPFGTTLKGMYIGLYPTIGWKNISVENIDDNFFVLGISGGAGYQWVFKNGFTIALGGAIGTTTGISNNDNSGQYDERLKPSLDLILNFKLGYSF